MKYLFVLIAAVFTIVTSANAKDLDEAKIYHFYQPMCPHCHEAIDYINVAYPDVKMELVDITTGGENYNLFIKCAKKFNLGREIGTPLFCMGGHYIMGWSEEQKKQFDEYVKEFKK